MGGPLTVPLVCLASLGMLGGGDVLVGPSGLQPYQATCFPGVTSSFSPVQPALSLLLHVWPFASAVPGPYGVCMEPP